MVTSTPAPDRQGPARGVARALGRLGSLLVVAGVLSAGPASAQFGERVVEVVVEQEGARLEDPLIDRLVGAAVDQPLVMRDVRETMTRLMNLRRFEDVQPHAEPADGGVRLRYVVVPLHPVDRVEFRGRLGLSERDVRRIVTERFGTAPDASRAAEVADTLRAAYRTRGYPEARVTPDIEVTHHPDRASLVLAIESGPRAVITDVQYESLDPPGVQPGYPVIRTGGPYDAVTIDRQLDEYVRQLRQQRYYEARATHSVQFEAGTPGVSVFVAVGRGPRVSIAYAGDSLPANERDRLVPVRAEGSADEDLLEDSVRAIREYLYERGYPEATAEFTRAETPEELTITFDVRRGPRYVVQDVRLQGNSALPDSQLTDLLRMRRGEPYVQRQVDTAVAAIAGVYRTRGFTRAEVEARFERLPPERPGDPTQLVDVVIAIEEGPLTTVRSIMVDGNEALRDEDLRQLMTTREGNPYSALALLEDRDRIDLTYRNRGFESVNVRVNPSFSEDDTLADIRLTISEGPQIFVDQIIITGNERINLATIERELLLRPREPLGYSALIESRSRLISLGLFRRVQIEQLTYGTDTSRDVLVQVEEAPPNTLGFGGGMEGGFRSRPLGPGGTYEERFELVPRGFFEVGRRNLWGKNRSVNLFSRVSLRSRDITDDGIRVDDPELRGSYGLNEYRVFATFREPRIFGTRANVLVTGILDRAIRTTFNFKTREVRAETGFRLSPRYSGMGRYSFKRTELFDARLIDDDREIIDRLFPQVRLSKFAGSLIRDTRDDLFDPTRGTFATLDVDLAARAIGSEVGFVRSYFQGFTFHRLPTTRRMVMALGGRVGVARGFPRLVERIADDGTPIVEVVQSLPASERFFAGGDTTVRGFSLDRLGNSETISRTTGFPTGGNGVLVFNAELRVALFRALQGVTFFDAGNVYRRASDINVTELRPAVGGGLWYRSPVGPVRLDLGFNLDRRTFGDRRERGYVVHLSLGPAF